MKKWVITAALCITVLFAQDMGQFCSAPPFVGGSHAVVIPNVLIVHDMTGSMRFVAYHYYGESYNPNQRYYGYADPDADYGRVSVSGRYYFQKKPAGSGTYSGNLINYAFMTRMDISRKAFTGGKGLAYDNKSRLLFEVPGRYYSYFGYYNYYGIVTTDSTELGKGIIRSISDTDDDYIWDEGAPNFALLVFSSDSRFYRRVRCPFGMSLDTMLMVLENNRPSQNNQPTGGTNCGDAIFEAIHYLRFCPAHWSGDYSNAGLNTPVDPWYDLIGNDTVTVSCRPTFCIVVGDGGSNSDHPVGNCSHLPHPASPYGPSYYNFYQYDGDNDPYDPCNWGVHDRCGDDYAYYAHVTDLRPDADPVYGIVDEQSVTFYSIYLFAQGDDSNADSIFFRKIAQYGGFIDTVTDTTGMPGYKKPDKVSEYDADFDGRPDNFFYVNDGQQLEDALFNIFINIRELARVTSASAASITGTSIKGSGLVYSAQFYPKLDLTSTLSLDWLGKATGLWLDHYGNLREDNHQPSQRILDLKQDHVVEMFFSPGQNYTMAARFADTSGRGQHDLFVPLDTVPVESLRYVMNCTDLLMTRDPDSRVIYTNQGGARSVFRADQAWLYDHLDFGTADQCSTLVEYIRGYDVPTWRSRLFQTNIWKLGDIIYSTPMPVAEPSEGYNLVYGDETYRTYWEQYKNRRVMVYAGANDGMLHAFHGGYYHDTLISQFEIGRIDSVPPALGEETWAFVPYNVLPHLKWLTDTSYCHVYYVDLKPYPTDVPIFATDARHPEGWGTILISGMRFGGGEITVPGIDTYRSSYCCFDVTDPDYDSRLPQFMWEFSDDSLGFTCCVPAMVKIKNSTGDEWFMVTGSGPQTKYGESTQQARVFVIDPTNGSLVHQIIVPENNSAITNIFTADYGLKYSVNLIYFGTYNQNDGGSIYRIMTHDDPNPTNWTLHKVIDLQRPITAEGTVGTDPRGNLWLYFGTGRYFSNVDVGDSSVMAFVGIKDDTTQGDPINAAFDYNDLINVTNVEIFGDSVGGLAGVNNFDELEMTVAGYQGWYIEFDSVPGERVVTTPILLGGAVIFTTFIPEVPEDTVGGPGVVDLCIGSATGGPQHGNLYALFYTTGTAYKLAMLDTTDAGKHLTHVSIVGDMPSEPAVHISADQEKTFIQSAGGLIGIETPLAYNPRGGVQLWRGK
jgi:type IV pilus assembly protein PilY1